MSDSTTITQPSDLPVNYEEAYHSLATQVSELKSMFQQQQHFLSQLQVNQGAGGQSPAVKVKEEEDIQKPNVKPQQPEVMDESAADDATVNNATGVDQEVGVPDRKKEKKAKRKAARQTSLGQPAAIESTSSGALGNPENEKNGPNQKHRNQRNDDNQVLPIDNVDAKRGPKKAATQPFKLNQQRKCPSCDQEGHHRHDCPRSQNVVQPLLKNALISPAEQENLKLKQELKRTNEQLIDLKRTITQLTKQNKQSSRHIEKLTRKIEKLTLKQSPKSIDSALPRSEPLVNQDSEPEATSSPGPSVESQTGTDDEWEVSDKTPLGSELKAEDDVHSAEKPKTARSLFKGPNKKPQKQNGTAKNSPRRFEGPQKDYNQKGAPNANRSNLQSEPKGDRLVVNSAKKSYFNGERRPLNPYRPRGRGPKPYGPE